MSTENKASKEEGDKKTEDVSKTENSKEEAKKDAKSEDKKEEVAKDSKSEKKDDKKPEDSKDKDDKSKDETAKDSKDVKDKSDKKDEKQPEDDKKDPKSDSKTSKTEDKDKKPTDKDSKNEENKGNDDHLSDDEHHHEHRDTVDQHSVAGSNYNANPDDTARKTFLTQKEPEERPSVYAFNEVLFPKGHPAKLCKILDADSEDLRVGEVVDNYKINDPTPVIILAGAHNDSRQSLMAGVCRAAYRTGATIIDSAVASSIEKFCIKKKVPLMGVIPDTHIVWPKINATTKSIDELTDGRTHIFSIGKKSRKAAWGDEADFKTNLAIRLSKGRIQYVKPACKVIVLCVGDNPNCVDELSLYAECGWPIIVLPGTQTSNDLLEGKQSGTSTNAKIREIVTNGKIFECPEEFGSEELASLVHLHLTVTIEQITIV